MDDRFYCDNMGVEYKDYSIFDLFKAEKNLRIFLLMIINGMMERNLMSILLKIQIVS